MRSTTFQLNANSSSRVARSAVSEGQTISSRVLRGHASAATWCGKIQQARTRRQERAVSFERCVTLDPERGMMCRFVQMDRRSVLPSFSRKRAERLARRSIACYTDVRVRWCLLRCWKPWLWRVAFEFDSCFQPTCISQRLLRSRMPRPADRIRVRSPHGRSTCDSAFLATIRPLNRCSQRARGPLWAGPETQNGARQAYSEVVV